MDQVPLFISVSQKKVEPRVELESKNYLPNKVLHVPHALLVILSSYFLAVQRYKFRIQPRYGLKKESAP